MKKIAFLVLLLFAIINLQAQKNMPAISMFYGIIIYMYFFDNKMHHLPHIHAKYQDEEVVVEIPKGKCWKEKYLQIKLNWYWHGLRF